MGSLLVWAYFELFSLIMGREIEVPLLVALAYHWFPPKQAITGNLLAWGIF